ncbi:uncharacterized protein LOC143805357 [Ranitomeya variabilis]|uniref:uncharacterized protein LOC143805357 n=1 Tax=Ranitomeya variabilis TaxID=490064 RepID=UPI004057531E
MRFYQETYFTLFTVNMDGFTCIVPAVLLLLSDSLSGRYIYIVHDTVNRSLGQSVFLETSYSLPPKISNYKIRWKTGNQAIIYYSAVNCTIGPHGSPIWTNGTLIIYPKYKPRTEFTGLNASLLLHNVQVSDSGIYTLLLSANNTWWERNIRVNINENVSINSDVSAQQIVISSVRMTLCFLLIAALVYTVRL